MAKLRNPLGNFTIVGLPSCAGTAPSPGGFRRPVLLAVAGLLALDTLVALFSLLGMLVPFGSCRPSMVRQAFGNEPWLITPDNAGRPVENLPQQAGLDEAGNTEDANFPTVPDDAFDQLYKSQVIQNLQTDRISHVPLDSVVYENAPQFRSSHDGFWPGQESTSQQAWQWEILPPGLMYRSYLAGEKEPRMAWSSLYDFKRERTVWETVLGGRVGLLRYGTSDILNPEGFQLDAEGAVFTRLLPAEPSTMMEAADFRFGFLGTHRRGPTAIKMGYYHVSSHLGDEFLIANPDFPRINYVRDAAIVGIIQDITPSFQAYGEIGNALGRDGGAKPWEFQWGCQYCPTPVRATRGAPYAGVNFYSRQEFNFEPSLNVIVGWNWAGSRTGERFRIGMQYYNGPALQYSFFDRRERLLGGGLWLDF